MALAAAIALWLPCGVIPAEAASPGVESPPAATADAQVESLWRARARAIEAGNREQADALIEQLLAVKVELGRRNLFSQAAAVISEAVSEADGGRQGRARVLLGFAQRLAPDYPPVYRAEAYLAKKGSPLNLVGYTLGLANDFRARFKDARYTVNLIGRASLSLAAAIVLWGLFWMIGMVAAHGGLVFHDIRERIGGGKRLVTAKARILAAVAFIGPLAVVFPSPLWLIALGILGSWIYQSTAERRITLAVTVLLAILPFSVWVASTSRAFLSDESTRALMDFSSGEDTPEDVRVIERLLKDRPADQAVRFALAQDAWRSGKAALAEESYRSLSASGSLRLQSTVNLGVILTSRKDLDGAEEMFRQALELDDSAAGAHYNLGQVLNMKFRFQDGENELRRAVQLDGELMSFHSAGAQDKGLMLERLPPWQIVRHLMRPRDLASLLPVKNEFWPLFLTNVPAQVFPIGLLLMGALGAFYANAFQGRGSRRCAKCQRPLCPLCSPARKASVCQQCQHVFGVKEGVESSLRVEKMVEIKSRQHRRRVTGLLLSVAAPGAGQTYLGHPISGALTGFLMAPALVLLSGWAHPFAPPSDLAYAWAPSARVVGGMLFAVLYPVNLVVTYFMAREDS